MATKVYKVLSIFGLRFALQYSLAAAAQIFFGRGSVQRVFGDHGVKIIEAGKNINAPQELEVLASYGCGYFLVNNGQSNLQKTLN